MNMKELLLGTVVIAGLSSSAYGNDKELVGDVAMGSFWWGPLQSHHQHGSGRKVSQ
ncbi:MAG: hypothetical protein WA366_14765 [Pseudolabrys sp.]|jgi:hypothetical protein